MQDEELKLLDRLVGASRVGYANQPLIGEYAEQKSLADEEAVKSSIDVQDEAELKHELDTTPGPTKPVLLQANEDFNTLVYYIDGALNTPVQIADYNPDRATILITADAEATTNGVYIGSSSSVARANGYWIPAGKSLILSVKSAVWALPAVGAAVTVSMIEVM